MATAPVAPCALASGVNDREVSVRLGHNQTSGGTFIEKHPPSSKQQAAAASVGRKATPAMVIVDTLSAPKDNFPVSPVESNRRCSPTAPLHDGSCDPASAATGSLCVARPNCTPPSPSSLFSCSPTPTPTSPATPTISPTTSPTTTAAACSPFANSSLTATVTAVCAAAALGPQLREPVRSLAVMTNWTPSGSVSTRQNDGHQFHGPGDHHMGKLGRAQDQQFVYPQLLVPERQRSSNFVTVPKGVRQYRNESQQQQQQQSHSRTYPMTYLRPIPPLIPVAAAAPPSTTSYSNHHHHHYPRQPLYSTLQPTAAATTTAVESEGPPRKCSRFRSGEHITETRDFSPSPPSPSSSTAAATTTTTSHLHAHCFPTLMESGLPQTTKADGLRSTSVIRFAHRPSSNASPTTK